MMKKLLLVMLVIGLSIIVVLPNVANAVENKIPEIDVSSFDSQHNSKLNGTWLYLNGLYESKEIEKNHYKGQLVNAPVSFKELNDSNNGVGTFATYVTVPKAFIGKELAIYIPYEYSAYKIYIDHKLETSVGTVAPTSNEHISSLEPSISYFVPKSEKVLITMQISSFDLMRGGFILDMELGTVSNIMDDRNEELFWTSLLTGCILVVALFTLVIGMYRSYGKEILIFGFFCISITFREICTVPYIYSVILPNFKWETIIRLDYLFTCCATFFFFWLIYTVTGGLFKKWALTITNSIIFAIAIFTIFADIKVFQQVFFILYFWSVPMIIYVNYSLFRAVKMKKKMALSNIIGIMIVFTAVLAEYMNGLGLITIPPVSFLATVIYVVIQLVFLSKQFSNEVFSRLKLNEELQQLNQCLDEKILLRTQELQSANNLLQNLANRDALTGIYNRHYFNEYMTQEFTNSIENSLPLGILVIDVDDFKKYNDFYGHIEGDQLLKTIANCMGEVLPEEGMLARYGGEEFVVVISDFERDDVIRLAEEIKQNIETRNLIHEGREEGIITVSIGVATLDEASQYTTMNDFINDADQKLYVGKKNGKNKVVY